MDSSGGSFGAPHDHVQEDPIYLIARPGIQVPARLLDLATRRSLATLVCSVNTCPSHGGPLNLQGSRACHSERSSGRLSGEVGDQILLFEIRRPRASPLDRTIDRCKRVVFGTALRSGNGQDSKRLKFLVHRTQVPDLQAKRLV